MARGHNGVFEVRLSGVRHWCRRRGASAETQSGSLHPLTSGYQPTQHQMYADHLDAGIANPSVRNIALTGRYGAGKSSVLDETQRRHGRRVLRVSLSNLGVDEGNEGLTNRIEKEFVKQLLHREPPRRVPQSRFRRISTRSVVTSFALTLVQAAVVGLAVWLVHGNFELAAFHGQHRWWVVVLGWMGLIVSVVATLTWLRTALRNYVVSQFSAAGASVTLSKADSTYFDEFLDEIVYFFARIRVDIVILEDLDRFDDPHIFQALRELNTVLNSSRQIRRGRHRRRICFVYAIRDSVFEKLGHDLAEPSNSASTDGTVRAGDAVAAEIVMANRTKFFDLVIPLVPFITHHNARDLLARLLTGAQANVSGDLIDVVARRLPDMRLLTNICNEYMVFTRRLITDKRGVQDLTPDKLFAMVVYKNVHLRDFENMLQAPAASTRSIRRAVT